MSFSTRTFIDRYFSRHYYVDVMNKLEEDMCLLVHSNGVCVLTLAPSHPVVRRASGDTAIKAIDYKVTEKLDRLENKVSGKSKRGAQFVVPESAICRIFCGEKGDAVYTVRACIKGRLVEVNERIINEPQLLVTNPETLGYICVIIQQRPQQDGDSGNAQTQSRCPSFPSLDRQSYLTLRFPGNPEAIEEMQPVCDDADLADE